MKKIILSLTIVCTGILNGMDPGPSCQSLPKELQQEIITTALAASKNFNEIINVIKNASILHGADYDHSATIDLLARQLPDDFDKAMNEVEPLQGTTLKNFTALIDIMAKKFPNKSREWFAPKFKTKVAKQYTSIANTFLKTIDREENPKAALTYAIDLLDKGVDPNYSWVGPDHDSVDKWIMKTLIEAAYDNIFAKPVMYGNIFDYNNGNESMMPIVTLLLDRGVKPNAHFMEHVTRISQRYPTDLNIKLLKLLHQAAENQ